VLNPWFAIISTSGVILAAVYMLWMFQRVMFGEVTNDENKELDDLDARELGLLIPVMVFIVWIGIYPSLFTGYSEDHVQQMLDQSKRKADAIASVADPVTMPGWAVSLYDVTEDLVRK
jgi:NADH-quinone oxidoreductase subunit M